jgi:hypothetical protein
MVSMGEIRNLLQSLQCNYLRTAVGAMKTTPAEVLEVALCQASLDLAAIQAVALTAYRLECQGEWRNIGLGHTRLKFLQKYPYTLNQDRILKKHQLVKPYEIRKPTRQDWQKPDKIIDHNVDLWFTDGSGIHDRFGAGIYGKVNVKVKFSCYRPAQALEYPEVKALDFLDFWHYEGGKVITSTHQLPLPPRVSLCSFLEPESTPGHMVPSVASEKIPSDTTGDRSRDSPTGSAMGICGPLYNYWESIRMGSLFYGVL